MRKTVQRPHGFSMGLAMGLASLSVRSKSKMAHQLFLVLDHNIVPDAKGSR